MCDPVHDVNTAAMGFVWGAEGCCFMFAVTFDNKVCNLMRSFG